MRSAHNLKSIEIKDNFEALIEQYLPKLEEITVFNDVTNGWGDYWFEKVYEFISKTNYEKIFYFVKKSLSQKIIPYLSRFERIESLIISIDNNVLNEHFISIAKN